MKLIFQYALAFFTVLSFLGCEDKPALFTEADGLYFGTADTTLAYSFAKYPKKLSDTLKIPVNILGNKATADRSFDVDVVAYSGTDAAVQGQHYKILSNLVVKANTIVGTLPIAVYRTADLEAGNAVKFIVKIRKDQSFPADGITSKQKLTINLAYIQKPASWGEFTGAITGYFAGYKDNFGTWTPTKYKLILDALYNSDTGETVTEFPGSRFGPPILYNQYVAVVRNYIKTNYPGNYGLPGATLTDPDNSNLPIQVGPANY